MLPEGVSAEVGQRALVPFAGKSYLGVVSELCGSEAPGLRNIREIYGIEEHKDRISRSEIKFWRSIADYYMCSVGEVYKAAYPSVKDETVRSKKKEEEFLPMTECIEGISPDALHTADLACEALDQGKPLLLETGQDENILLELCLRHADKNILWLVPEVRMSKMLEQRVRDMAGSRLIVWGANITPAKKREAARKIRSGTPYILLGTRSSLFLPHNGLGLVIVQDEHEISYKQNSPAPRYNGRDAAVMLAAQSGAKVVLESDTPSFESLLNTLSGKYTHVRATQTGRVNWEIVDTHAELRKKGMRGEVSVKMIEAATANPDKCAFFKARRAAFPKSDVLRESLANALGEVFYTEDLVENPVPADSCMLGVFGADSLLGRPDFRADERLIQTIGQAASQCRDSLQTIVVQTKDASHPVFETLCSGCVDELLSERKVFGYPPFTRIIDIVVKDDFADRQGRMIAELHRRLAGIGIGQAMAIPGHGIRLILQKDRNLATRKRTVVSLVEDFEKACKYSSHIFFDVDPQ